MARLKVKYTEEVAPALFKKFGYKSTMQIPKIEKVVLNVGCGEAARTPRSWTLSSASCPRSPARRPSSPSPRSPWLTSSCVRACPLAPRSLRGDKMWEFLDRLFNVALPRVRDFRGISANAFDGRGNYALGIKEQLIFPEIEYDKIDKIRGMDIVICTTAQTDEEARELLTLVGAPFER